MRRFWAGSLALMALLVAAAIATAGTGLGVPMRDYHWGFLALGVAAAAGWPLLRRRRVTSMLVLYTGILATASGFLLLYLKDGLKDAGLKDWMKWWHSVTSVALLIAFLVHWLHNHARLTGFARRLLTRDRHLGLPVVGGWALVGAIGALTWSDAGKALFTEGNYLLLSGWAVLAGVSFAYGLWLLFLWPRLRERLAAEGARNRARALVDTSLWLAHWLALLTGFALLYLKDFLHGNGYKHVSKWWHTSTSVAFVALVVLHVGFNARLVAAHARRIERDLGRSAGDEPAPPALAEP